MEGFKLQSTNTGEIILDYNNKKPWFSDFFTFELAVSADFALKGLLSSSLSFQLHINAVTIQPRVGV